MTSGVCCRTVYFGRIFTRKSSTTMRTLTAVSVYDDFAAWQSGIPVRTSDYKFAGRVNMKFDIVCKQSLKLGLQLCFYTWNQNIFNVFCDFHQHIWFSVKLIMLR